jgi:hypothetical protein
MLFGLASLGIWLSFDGFEHFVDFVGGKFDGAFVTPSNIQPGSLFSTPINHLLLGVGAAVVGWRWED